MPNSRHRLGTQAKRVSKDVQELGVAAKDTVQEDLGRLRKTVAEHYQQGRDTLLSANRSIGQRIREMPVLSILIAAGAGLLLGVLWTIRRR